MTATPEPDLQESAPDLDLALGTFSDHPPWLIDPDRLTWLPGLDVTRDSVRRQVPELTRPRRLPGFRVVKVVGEPAAL